MYMGECTQNVSLRKPVEMIRSLRKIASAFQITSEFAPVDFVPQYTAWQDTQR